MEAPDQQPDPDGGDALGPEPGGSPQDELDFSILFNYEYMNPIEGRWRLPPTPTGLAPQWGLAWGGWVRAPLLQMSLFWGLGEGVPLPREREGTRPGTAATLRGQSAHFAPSGVSFQFL